MNEVKSWWVGRIYDKCWKKNEWMYGSGGLFNSPLRSQQCTEESERWASMLAAFAAANAMNECGGGLGSELDWYPSKRREVTTKCGTLPVHGWITRLWIRPARGMFFICVEWWNHSFQSWNEWFIHPWKNECIFPRMNESLILTLKQWFIHRDTFAA